MPKRPSGGFPQSTIRTDYVLIVGAPSEHPSRLAPEFNQMFNLLYINFRRDSYIIDGIAFVKNELWYTGTRNFNFLIQKNRFMIPEVMNIHNIFGAVSKDPYTGSMSTALSCILTRGKYVSF